MREPSIGQLVSFDYAGRRGRGYVRCRLSDSPHESLGPLFGIEVIEEKEILNIAAKLHTCGGNTPPNTGWNVRLNHMTFDASDYKQIAAEYIAITNLPPMESQ